MKFLKAVTLATLLLATGAGAQVGDYEAALRDFRDGRWSAAYGGFVAAANDGHPDAARFALFMYRYGPAVYNTRWDATDDELAAWTRIAAPVNRVDPEYGAQAPRRRPTYHQRAVPFQGNGRKH